MAGMSGPRHYFDTASQRLGEALRLATAEIEAEYCRFIDAANKIVIRPGNVAELDYLPTDQGFATFLIRRASALVETPCYEWHLRARTRARRSDSNIYKWNRLANQIEGAISVVDYSIYRLGTYYLTEEKLAQWHSECIDFIRRIDEYKNEAIHFFDDLLADYANLGDKTLQEFLSNVATEIGPEDVSSDDMCGICHEVYHDEESPLFADKIIGLPCHETHQFHLSCISNWLAHKPQCPCDRRTMFSVGFEYDGSLFQFSREHGVTITHPHL